MDWEKHSRAGLERIGEPGEWTPAGGSTPAPPVTGFFVSPYMTIQGIAAGSNPVFVCMAADVPGIAQGDTFTVRSVDYKIAGPEPDLPSGRIVLQLEKP